MVSKHESIPLDAVWDLGVMQFLNDLVYIKYKQEYDAYQYTQSTSGRTR